jgi:hypothetical protein
MMVIVMIKVVPSLGKRKRRLLPKKNRDKIIERDGHKCFYCESVDVLTIDHIVPVAHGGSDTASNLITCCHSCNSKKNKKRLLPRFENEVLDVVTKRNIKFGIDNTHDMSRTRKKRKKNESRPKREKKPLGWKRQVLIEKAIDRAFSTNNTVYTVKTKDAKNTVMLINRMKRRHGKYLSIPCNEFGGKIFLIDRYDKKTRSQEITRSDAIDLFVVFKDKSAWGYLSGNM